MAEEKKSGEPGSFVEMFTKELESELTRMSYGEKIVTWSPQAQVLAVDYLYWCLRGLRLKNPKELRPVVNHILKTYAPFEESSGKKDLASLDSLSRNKREIYRFLERLVTRPDSGFGELKDLRETYDKRQ